MNSPFADIFVAVQQRIAAEVPAIAYVDQELGQLKNSRPPVSWPCLLIDLEDFRFENVGTQVQLATGTVVLLLGFAAYSTSWQGTPPEATQKALNYYDIEWALHKALHGWTPGGFTGSLARTGAATQKRTDHYRVRELRYSIAFDDYSTKRTIRFVPAALEMTEEMNNSA